MDDDSNIAGVDDFNAGDTSVDDECEVLTFVNDNRLEFGVDLHDDSLRIFYEDAVFHLQLSCLNIDVFPFIVADSEILANHFFLLGLLHWRLWLRLGFCC